MNKHYNPADKRSRLYDDFEVPIFGHPDEVVRDHRLTVPEKKALLASWASDANAVPGMPMLRQLPGGAIVQVSAILDALKELDDSGSPSGRDSAPRARRSALQIVPIGWLRRKNKGPGDDDPPPCPAMAARPPRSGSGGTVAAVDLVAA